MRSFTAGLSVAALALLTTQAAMSHDYGKALICLGAIIHIVGEAA